MAFKTRTAAALLGAGLALVAGAPTASAASAANPYHPSAVPNVVVLGIANSPHCLEIADWRTDSGAPARQWDCHYGGSQQWSLTAGPTGSLVNVHSGKCLEVADWRTDNGAPVRQWACTGGASQQWTWTHVPGTGYVLRNVHSGKCLEVDGRYTTNGARAQQWDCWNGNNQIWYPFSPNH
ncbi:RICIN domain-containing protein [Kitasatospora sp. NPDC048365]|uniref:RICIN domain-containing protein n=1 Tax=Kitasatospora sp. NPDC048365 TaxID=3364050 RepID=UPI00371F9450